MEGVYIEFYRRHAAVCRQAYYAALAAGDKEKADKARREMQNYASKLPENEMGLIEKEL